MQAKQRRDAAEAKKKEGAEKRKAPENKSDARLTQLIESCKVLLTLLSEPKRRNAPKFMKPIVLKNMRAKG